MRRGEIWMCDLGDGKGSEQVGVRPCLILQNDIGNKYAPTTVIAPLTSKIKKGNLPTHVTLDCNFLPKVSAVEVEQIRIVSNARLLRKMGQISKKQMKQVNEALMIELGLEA